MKNQIDKIILRRQIDNVVSDDVWTDCNWTFEDGVMRIWNRSRTLIIPLQKIESMEIISQERVTTK